MHVQLDEVRRVRRHRHRIRRAPGSAGPACLLRTLLTAVLTGYGFSTGGGTDAISSRTESGSVNLGSSQASSMASGRTRGLRSWISPECVGSGRGLGSVQDTQCPATTRTPALPARCDR